MQTGKRRRRLIQSVGLIVAIAALCAALWPRDRLLLQKATRITSENVSPISAVSHVWLSDNEVLWLFYDQNFTPHFQRVDVSHHTTRVMPGWSPGNMPVTFFGHANLSVSSDHQLLLWIEHGDDSNIVCGARIDGTHRFNFLGPDGHVGDTFWLSDSVHWLEFSDDWIQQAPMVANRYSFMKPDDKKPETVPLPPIKPTESTFLTMSRLISDHHVLGVELPVSDEPVTDVNVIDMNFLPTNPICLTFRVPVPPNMAIREQQFSPNGDRIAWLGRQHQESPMTVYLRRIFPIMKRVPRQSDGIWISHLDGSQMHEVGHLPLIDENMILENLQWLPSGKRLSFTYKGALYTVLAD